MDIIEKHTHTHTVLVKQQCGSAQNDINSRRYGEGIGTVHLEAEGLRWAQGECVNTVTKPDIYRHFHTEV